MTDPPTPSTESLIAVFERHASWEILEFASAVTTTPTAEELRRLEDVLFDHNKAKAARTKGGDPYLLSIISARRAEESRLGSEGGLLREENAPERRLCDILITVALRRMGLKAPEWLTYIEEMAKALQPQYPEDAALVKWVHQRATTFATLAR